MKKKISIGQYNSLFAIAEVGIQQTWTDLGLTSDEVVARSEQNPELTDIKKKSCSNLPECYFLYKKNANQIVDQILADLGIEVDV